MPPVTLKIEPRSQKVTQIKILCLVTISENLKAICDKLWEISHKAKSGTDGYRQIRMDLGEGKPQ